MDDREKTVIPTRICVVKDGEGKLHFRFEKDKPFGSVIHDEGEEVVHEIKMDFSEVDPIVSNAFHVAFEMDTLDSNGEAPMEQLLEFMVGIGYWTCRNAAKK